MLNVIIRKTWSTETYAMICHILICQRIRAQQGKCYPTKCWINIGPPSMTSTQYCPNIGLIYCVCMFMSPVLEPIDLMFEPSHSLRVVSQWPWIPYVCHLELNVWRYWPSKPRVTSGPLRGLPFNIRGGGGQGYWDGPKYFFSIWSSSWLFFSSCTVNKLFISTTFGTTFKNCQCIIY